MEKYKCKDHRIQSPPHQKNPPKTNQKTETTKKLTQYLSVHLEYESHKEKPEIRSSGELFPREICRRLQYVHVKFACNILALSG